MIVFCGAVVFSWLYRGQNQGSEWSSNLPDITQLRNYSCTWIESVELLRSLDLKSSCLTVLGLGLGLGAGQEAESVGDFSSRPGGVKGRAGGLNLTSRPPRSQGKKECGGGKGRTFLHFG
jgi:hypothetical protein